MAIKIRNRGVYNTLVARLDSLARHDRQGSCRTKERYYEAMKRFCAFLADGFHLQKLENISAKRLALRVEHLQHSGKSASTIKTDLAAIRFFHDKMALPKYKLPSNRELVEEDTPPLDARYRVSRLLGRERPDVTNIYLASPERGERDGR